MPGPLVDLVARRAIPWRHKVAGDHFAATALQARVLVRRGLADPLMPAPTEYQTREMTPAPPVARPRVRKKS